VPRARSESPGLPAGIQLDRDSDVPVGVQLAWHLRSLIGAGGLTTGDRLPGVREFAGATGVNVNTVRAVYARLEAEGLVATEHGRGTFVAARAGADERLSDIVERAAREAQDAGLDPREVAAALFVNRPGAAGARAAEEPSVDEASVRQALRREIAELERRLADERLQRVGAVPVEEQPRYTPATVTGGRILSLDELRAARDELRDRLTLLEGAERSQERAAAQRRATRSAEEEHERAARPPARATSKPGTRTRLTLTPGPVSWNLRYEG
jgi:DNA-binding transcriptional regulator YhcF (GntR family)